MKRFSTKINTSLFIILGLLFSVSVSSTSASALTYSSDVGVQFTFNSALQIDLSSADIHILNLAPGTTSDSNVIDVVVKTNNVTGYTLNATVGNSTTYNTRNLVHEVSGSSANFTSINYGSSLASLTTDNTWGYSYSTDNGTNWEDYDGLPLYSDATNIATLKEASVPPATSAGDKVNFKIAAKASTTQASGDYNNVINFVATANPVPTLGPVACTSGKICYNNNSLDEAEGTMGQQTASASTATVLLASNYSRDDYGFAGWSDTYDYSGNLYGPQEEITTPADMSSGLSLYAIWIPSAGSMQTSDATSACNSLTPASAGFKSLASVSALTDDRDDETYAIAKLADGNCWMIENLRLADKDNNNNDVILSSTNTNNPSLPLTNIYDTSSTSNHLSPTSSIAYAADTAPEGWCSTSSAACIDQSRIRTDNTANRATYTSGQTVSSQEANLYSYGNYYNWYSATAGNGTYSFNTNNNSVGGDLCPTGWRLPKGGDKTRITSNNDNEFWNLIVTGLNGGTLPANYDNYTNPYYNGSTEAGPIANALRTYPNNFLYSGDVDGASLDNRGSYGDYWSSTVSTSGNAYGLYFYSTSVYPGTSSDIKYNGRTVRCLAPSS